jgi:hypothetical protein
MRQGGPKAPPRRRKNTKRRTTQPHKKNKGAQQKTAQAKSRKRKTRTKSDRKFTWFLQNLLKMSFFFDPAARSTRTNMRFPKVLDPGTAKNAQKPRVLRGPLKVTPGTAHGYPSCLTVLIPSG